MIVAENGRVLFSASKADVFGAFPHPSNLAEVADFMVANSQDARYYFPEERLRGDVDAVMEGDAYAIAAVENRSHDLAGVAIFGVSEYLELIRGIESEYDTSGGLIEAVFVRPDLRNLGIGTGLVRASLRFLTNTCSGLGQGDVTALHDADNPAAATMLGKAGMTIEDERIDQGTGLSEPHVTLVSMYDVTDDCAVNA